LLPSTVGPVNSQQDASLGEVVVGVVSEGEEEVERRVPQVIDWVIDAEPVRAQIRTKPSHPVIIDVPRWSAVVIEFKLALLRTPIVPEPVRESILLPNLRVAAAFVQLRVRCETLV